MHVHARPERFVQSVLLAFLLIFALTGPANTQSDFYRYVDENGQVRYTDNPANVPPDQYQAMPQEMQTDAAAQRLSSDVSAQQRIVVNYDGKGGMILVNAVLDRHFPVVFQLDTGATRSMITENDAHMLNVPIESAHVVRGLIADGSIVELPVVHLASIGLGEAVVENLDVTVGKVRLLGMDFLENFELNIDSRVGQLVLVAKEPAAAVNGLKREAESDAARQDREQAKREIGNQIAQLKIAIKTCLSIIEEYRDDIEELERERGVAEAALNATRTQARFQSSGVSRDRWDESDISRTEKKIENIDAVIQNRRDLVKLHEEKASGMKSRINHLQTLRSRIH